MSFPSSSATERPIISLGCAFWDTILRVPAIPRHGTKVLAEDAVQAASGMATAAAVTIARLGGRVDLWSRIGDDATGDAFLDDLAREGVGHGRVRRVPDGRTWISTIIVDAEGERLVVPFADPALDRDPGWLPLHEIADAAAVLVDMRWPEAAEPVLAEARRCRVPTILDADVAPPELLRRMIPLADHVLFSEPALLSLVPGADVGEALTTIAADLPAVVVGVTLGAEGALMLTDGALSRVAAIPIAAQDTLNAGDVWHGAYALGLVRGWDLVRRVRVANVAAAMKCEVFGGRRGAPTLAAVLARLAEAK
ncbi:ribokinase [Aliidongia dinghuensis]|uniref:Ribokinase n=1 Tax=Aliidongia dinghuensis TaxID=1867774 RepID=A0A8J2YQW9_9PROT|nr:PfkB family carbohydrate kinase [Aliidongia dinghuensis]GGF06810.1 ribokinase [Aliidongia dinghuensis]